MDEKSLFTKFWADESRTTRNVLARIPEGSTYKPDPKSRTAQEIAWQIACEEAMIIEALESGSARWDGFHGSTNLWTECGRAMNSPNTQDQGNARVGDKSVAEKAHVKPGASIALINEDVQIVDRLGFPEPRFVEDVSGASIVLLFVRDKEELASLMPDALRNLAPEAALWVFFRKGSKAAGLNMSRDDVWRVAEQGGLRPLGLNSVDDTWSVFRLRR